MPGPIHFTPPPRATLANTLGASYIRNPHRVEGPMAPPEKHQYPNVWAKKGKKR